MRAPGMLLILLATTGTWASASDASDQDSSATLTEHARATAGLVVGYGAEVLPPFEFTGIGTDALYLNGLQYFPRPPDPSREIVVSAEMAALSAARQELHAQAHSLTAGLPAPERAQTMADIYRGSTLVADVQVLGTGSIRIEWVEPPTLTIFEVQDVPYPQTTPPVRPAPRSTQGQHEILMEQFWWLQANGGVVAFGENYFIRDLSRDGVEGTRQLLSELETGRIPDEEAWQRSILKAPYVRRSVLRAYGLEVQEP